MSNDLDRRLADTPIAIVGLSALFPKSRDLREFWSNIVAARDCIEDVPSTHWNVDDYYDPDPSAQDKTYCRRGGFVPTTAFNPLEFGMPPNTLEVTDILQLLSLVVAREVLADAGAPGSSWYDPARTGVVLGITGANSLTQPLATRLQTPVLKEVIRSCGLTGEDAEAIAAKFTMAFAPWEENSFPGMLGNVVAGRIANRFDLGGTNCTLDAACASSLAATRMAIDELLLGRADMMITGGCDAENTILMYLCFSKTPAFSKTGVIRPFDEQADGTLIGEGIGMLALKRLADAERDGDRVYAVISGMGSSSDGRFKSIYAPRASGQQLALQRAYADARINAGDIELIEAHGTGTAVGDHTELTALREVYSAATPERQFAAIGSVKSQIGHTKAAAGAAGLIKLALALHSKVLPPTLNVTQPSSAADFGSSAFYVNSVARPWILDPNRPRRRAAVSAFGFGGTNFHCVLEEHAATAARPEPVASLHSGARILNWHAGDVQSLRALLAGVAEPSDEPIPAEHARIVFTAHDSDGVEQARAQALKALDGPGTSWALPSGVHFREQAMPATKIGALFAGQGSQYVDMARTAVLSYPPMRSVLDKANSYALAPTTLARVIFPPPPFSDAERQSAEETLRLTQHAQPAIGAISAAHFTVLRELGLPVDGYLGHSFGELTALWAAGSLTDHDFTTLARARGAAMATPPGAGSDPGAMAAVNAGRDQVASLIAGLHQVWICNDNAPDQIVVGGATQAIEQLLTLAGERGLRAQRLPVSAAFHTPFVSHAVSLFGAAVAAVDLRAPSGPVYSTTQGQRYGSDIAANRQLLTDQLTTAVEFRSQIEAMHDDGFGIFVEFGPKKVLATLVARCLPGRDVLVVSMDQGPRRDSELSMKQAIAALVAAGVELRNVNRWQTAAPVEQAAKGMVIELDGVNYVSDKRRADYQEALTNGYRVVSAAPVVAAPAAVAVVVEVPVVEAPVADGIDRAELSAALIGIVASITGYPADMLDDSMDIEADLGIDSIKRVEILGNLRDAFPQAPALGPQHLADIATLADIVTLLAGTAPAPVLAVNVATPVVIAAPALIADQAVVATPVAAPAAVAVVVEVPVVDGIDRAELSAALIGIVASITGYPADMLDDSMDIEADLGIDSIKRVEILGNLRDAFPQAPALGPQHLADIATLADIVTLLAGTAPAPVLAVNVAAPVVIAAPAPVAALPAVVTAPVVVATPVVVAAVVVEVPVVEAPVADGIDRAELSAALIGIVASITGYPADMLDDSMDIEADLGIDSIKRVEILGSLRDAFPQAPALGPQHLADIATLADIVTLLAGAAPASTVVAPALIADQAVVATPVAAPAAVAVVVEAPVVEVPVVEAPVADGIDRAELSAALIGIVASITGYPADMLDDSMDIEADLGIDSIKRVEILGNLRDAFPQAPALGPQHLADIATLADIVTLLAGTTAASAPAPAASAPAPAASAPAPAASAPAPAASAPALADAAIAVSEHLDTETHPDSAVAAHGIGRHSVALCRLRAADFLKWPGEHKVAVVIDDGGRGRAVTYGLQQDGFSVYLLTLPGADPVSGALLVPDWSEQALAAPIAEILTAEGGIDLCVYLATAPALTWEAAQQRLVTGLLAAKITQPALEQAAAQHGRGAFVTVTALDGALGHRGAVSEPDAVLGGLTGLIKTLAIEAPSINCRSIDLVPSLEPDEVAAAIVAEIHDPSTRVSEVGIDHDGRWGWELLPFAESQVDLSTAPALNQTDTVLVTGGARGVTAACAVELARRYRPKLVLLGRTALQDEPSWAAGTSDAVELRSAAVSDLRAQGLQPKPRDVEKLVAAVLGGREVRQTLAAARAAGAEVDYVAADVTDGLALDAALAGYRGCITAVVHGAGLLADQEIVKKTAADTAQVLAAKITGLRNVLAVVDGPKLARVVLFSSVAGLFGNYGQSDYAMANEALNKLARCGIRRAQVTSINWGAWDGGMVSPELAAMFGERGITLVPVPVGAAMLADEFAAGRAADQVVMFGPVAALSEPAVPSPAVELSVRRSLAGVGATAGLRAHQLGGVPVLPLTYALGLALNTVEQITGAVAVSAQDVRLLNGVVFDASVPDALQVVLTPTGSDTFRAHIADADAGRRPRYSVGSISTGAGLLTGPASSPLGGSELVRDLSVYSDGTLFHGRALQGLRGQLPAPGGTLNLVCRLSSAGDGELAWSAARYSADLTDLALQACLMWLRGEAGQPSLPTALGEITLLQKLPCDADFRLVVTGQLTSSGARCQVDAYAADGALLAQLRNVVLVVSPNLAAAFGNAPVPGPRTPTTAGIRVV
jgi:acyl transferase domain-containing protein/acyl carrier protein/NADP-dependent 3-hydroxy acid dehydrogenase YdfG